MRCFEGAELWKDGLENLLRITSSRSICPELGSLSFAKLNYADGWDRKQQQKASRQKILAQVGPRLEVLQNMPFVIPFETRVQIFRQFVLLDQTRRRGGNVDPDIWRMSVIQQSHMLARPDRTPGHDILSRHHAKIRRHEIFEDAFNQFYDLGEGMSYIHHLISDVLRDTRALETRLESLPRTPSFRDVSLKLHY